MSECDHKSSKMRRPWPTRGGRNMKQKCNLTYHVEAQQVSVNSSQHIYKTDYRPLNKHSSPNGKLFINESVKIGHFCVWGKILYVIFSLVCIYKVPFRYSGVFRPMFSSRYRSTHPSKGTDFFWSWQLLS